ncbi:endospore germination permease [Paenibacillus sp. 7124]|uniref:Endospore germination permease n=1 Tax=Paenibacillus apii TaxID=1850370 RepID=A0A6M1PJN3_9BACL|nr:endospore germination permease [Paenibacillus apii]NGM82764.1 endospore germination permease [Paenibacillus apii]NJJ39905.1 endospore germination permease [Paenibacillus apii]
MRGKIGNVQAIFLVVSAIFPTAIVVLPVIIGKYLEQDSPLAVIFSGLIGLGIAWLIGTIIKATGGAPFLEWAGRKISPVFAVVIGILLLQYYLDLTTNVLRVYVNFIKDNVLLNTPTVITAVIIMLVTLYMISRGIEAISRINSIVNLMLLMIFPLYIWGLTKHINLHRLLPIFDHSAASFALASLTPIGWMSEVSVLLFFGPYLKFPRKGTFIGVIGICLVTLVMFVEILMTLVVFGPQYMKDIAYPIFSTISIIQVGRFIENLDVLFISYWTMSVYMKLAIFLFATVQCFKQTFRIRNDRPYLVALSVVIITECLYTWREPEKLNLFNEEGRIIVFLLFNILLPLGILLWTRIKEPVIKRKEYKT